MDTVKISKLINKHLGGKYIGFGGVWIKADAKKLAKTIPLHTDSHRIYHRVTKEVSKLPSQGECKRGDGVSPVSNNKS